MSAPQPPPMFPKACKDKKVFETWKFRFTPMFSQAMKREKQGGGGQNLQMEEADFASQKFAKKIAKIRKISQNFATHYFAQRSLSTPQVTDKGNARDAFLLP